MIKAKLQFNYDAHKTVLGHCTTLLNEMKPTFSTKWKSNAYCIQCAHKSDIVGTVQECLEELAAQQQLKCIGLEVFNKYKSVLSLYHMWTNYQWMYTAESNSKMPWKLSQHGHILAPRNIMKPGELWFQHHEDAGWIHPSNLSSASLSFLVPKAQTPLFYSIGWMTTIS